jgi:GAF domain-containing protein
MRPLNDSGAVLDRVSAAVRDAVDADAAMNAVVELLARGVPHYTWVGIYLLEGNELVLGPYVGKPSPHPAFRSGAASAGPQPPGRPRSSSTT